MRFLEEIALELEEIEAIRLADLEGLYQLDAAPRIGVSRQTFGNMIDKERVVRTRIVVRLDPVATLLGRKLPVVAPQRAVPCNDRVLDSPGRSRR